MDNPAIYIPSIGIAIVAIYLLRCIRILYEYERGVVFRLGRVLLKTKGPGLIMVFWPVDRMVRVSMRTERLIYFLPIFGKSLRLSKELFDSLRNYEQLATHGAFNPAWRKKTHAWERRKE